MSAAASFAAAAPPHQQDQPERRVTRSDVLKHVLTSILEEEEGSPLWLALEAMSIRSIVDLLSLSDESIDGLFFKEGNTKVNVPVTSKNAVKALKAWNYYLISYQDMSVVNWMDDTNISPAQFDIFRVTAYDPDNAQRKVTPPRFSEPSIYEPSVLMSTPGRQGKTNIPESVPSNSMPTNSAKEFRKGIRRDKTHYSVLKDEKSWDDWRRSTISTIYAHGCQNILSSSYLPETTDEINLFQEQQNFMYDVLNHCLKTPMGSHYVRTHETTRDAQAVWRDYVKHMRNSSRADLEIEDLMNALVSHRADTKDLGNVEQFIIDWLNNIRLYETLTPISAHFPDIMKKAMLQNALNTFSKFREVKSNEQLDIAKGRGPLSYQAYVQLVQQVAVTFDSQISAQRKRKTRTSSMTHNFAARDLDGNPSLHVHMSDVHEEMDGSIHDDYDDGVTEQFGSFTIHESRTQRPPYRRPSLRKDVWQSLSRADQLAWDNLSHAGKQSIILGFRNSNNSMPPTTARGANLTDTSPHDPGDLEQYHDTTQDLPPDDHGDVLIQAAKRSSTAVTPTMSLPPHDVRRLLGSNTPSASAMKPAMPTPTPPRQPATTSSRAPSRRIADVHILRYNVAANTNSPSRGALVDRGANGGMAGADTRIIARTDRNVDVTGIDNHELVGLPIVTAGAVVPSDKGPVIAILHQYAYIPQGRTIHSSLQLEHFGNIVDDRSTQVRPPGTQTIQTLDGYRFSLTFHQGLPYLPCRPFSDDEWNRLPHVVFTSDAVWDPSTLDTSPPPPPSTVPPVVPIPPALTHPDFDVYGRYSGISVSSTQLWQCNRASLSFRVHARVLAPAHNDFAPYTHRAPFPALNVRRRNEPVATDTNGATAAQIFVGLHSRFASAYSMTTDSQFANTLMDVVRHHGAMDVLISDSARAEMSTRVQNILRHLCIDDWQSESEYQHQNYAERRYQTIKHNVNRVLNSSGAPGHAWFLCLRYVIFIMNRMALGSIDWRTPFEQLTGHTPDISMIYRFRFWERVLFARTESRGGAHFPSQSNEDLGRFVGFSEHVGHPMTYIILTEDTSKIIYRSRIKSFITDPNLRLLPATLDAPEAEEPHIHPPSAARYPDNYDQSLNHDDDMRCT
eukprot:Nitzschia sp. Nitz4//scaffold143_size57137//53597//57072//NITZ4_006523-RA/size57137-processed-gene-0.42-mRNA-1//1//CDS//3329536473//6205//frame0